MDVIGVAVVVFLVLGIVFVAWGPDLPKFMRGGGGDGDSSWTGGDGGGGAGGGGGGGAG